MLFYIFNIIHNGTYKIKAGLIYNIPTPPLKKVYTVQAFGFGSFLAKRTIL